MAERRPDPDTLIFLSLQRLEDGIQELREDLVAMLSFHKKMLALLEAQQAPPVKIADFDDLYAEEEEDEKEMLNEITPQPGGWRKVFPKRNKA